MIPAAPRKRIATNVALSLCLFAACSLALAQSAPPPTQNAPAQNSPAGTPIKLNLIVTDESGSSAVEVRREEISLTEDGVPQTITHFAREELPVSYGVLVDSSGSMREFYGLVVRTAGSIISGNGPNDETFLVQFVDSEKIEQTEDFTADRETLMKGLARMYIDGGQTAIIDAVYLSAKKVSERPAAGPRRRALVLITDGEDRASVHKLEELHKLLRRTDVQIFSIGVGPKWPKDRVKLAKDKKAKLLLEVAQLTGGRAFFANDIADLRAAADEITRDLRAHYVVGYTSTNPNVSDKSRKIEIKVAGASLTSSRTAITRPGYNFPPAGGGKDGKN